jgi:hypothetical protein
MIYRVFWPPAKAAATWGSEAGKSHRDDRAGAFSGGFTGNSPGFLIPDLGRSRSGTKLEHLRLSCYMWG